MRPSFFHHISNAPKDSIFGVLYQYSQDLKPNKINLTMGVYLDEKGSSPIAPYLKKGEELLLKRQKSKVYLSQEGDLSFIEATKERLFVNDTSPIVGIQTVGGTGALRIAFDYIKREFNTPVYVPNSTWSNHFSLLEGVGLEAITYPYFDPEKRTLLFDEMVDFLSKQKEGSIVLLHACCHNPSGLDPSEEEWKSLAELFVQKRLIPLFDMAYQGLGKGFEADAFSVRYFHGMGLEMFVAYSYSKMFDLYKERVGALMVINHGNTLDRMLSVFRLIIRRLYSNPPAHGAETVELILNEPSLCLEWQKDLEERRGRAQLMRALIVEKFQNILDVESIRRGVGYFAFLGLKKDRVLKLREKGLYMLDDSRINVLGVNPGNIENICTLIRNVL